MRTRHPDVHEITTGSLAAAIEAATRPRIIDARAGEEFEVSHLPGARWIGAADALAGLDPRTDPVVVYCSVGYRSAEYARHLAALGFRHARNLSGGIFKWANEGRPLQAPRGAPAKVHGFSASWQHLLAPHLRHLP
ncbi:MAG: rhodanese-like domain-containing protein [Deltaproteobacteria bacterium]|nr:rhodanese-like domain-containing protein [Deltaproteobacteria bacterium]